MVSSTNIKSLFKQEIKFIAGADEVKRLPSFSENEVAFIGKSNVGKSSLINAVCNRRSSLARVSHTPGRTQQINFFSVGNNQLILVDLPGYGFAKVPLAFKIKWEKLILHYLANRDNLKLVNVLIDARRGIKDHDLAVIDLLLQHQRKFQIVFTKLDQIKNLDNLTSQSRDILLTRNVSVNMIAVSARKKENIDVLRYSFFSND